MAKFILAAFFLVSVNAFAHVEPGTYKGLTSDGKACSMTAAATYFEGGKKHPLNERIKITVDAVEFIVGHPAVVDAGQALASFNHDLFQGVLPSATGAQALVIEMVHTEAQEGPKAFTLIDNNWKTGAKSSLRCNDIKLAR